MKALSIKQPWATWIAQGRKTIETRTWRTHHRGPLLICASKLPNTVWDRFEHRTYLFPTGCAVALCELVDCRPMIQADEPGACCDLYEGAWAWILADIRPLWTRLRVRGYPGLFDIDDALVEPVLRFS